MPPRPWEREKNRMGREFSVVGKRLPRVDALEKVTGTAKFAGDLKLPGVLVGKVLRSPYAHAKIKKIDTSKAESLPGVVTVITLQDIVPKRAFIGSYGELPMISYGAQPNLADQYVLTDKARFVGDPVAAVAATSENIALEALKFIDVEYERLPAVFDAVEATKEGAPKIHEGAEGNIAVHWISPLSKGDVEKGFREADCIVEGTFCTTKQMHGHIEPATAIAQFDITGRLTVWSQTQQPHPARRQLAYLFDMPVGNVKVITPFVGGSYGGRNGMNPEFIAAALARKARRPVKLEHTKDEDFHAVNNRSSFAYTAKLGFKKDGTLVAIKVKAWVNAGAYLCRTTTATSVFMGNCLEGPYRCRNKIGEADLVYTNLTPSGSCRGMGNPEAMWGIEQLMDMAAEKLGMDPLEIRLKNLKHAGEPSYVGLPIESTALEECIKLGAKKVGWSEKRGKRGEGRKRRGLGVAIMTHNCGAHPILVAHSGAYIKLNEDGSVNLIAHPEEAGTGMWGAVAQIAAEELGIRIEDVHVVYGDTDTTLFDIGSVASGKPYIFGNAVKQAAREVREQLFEQAAKMLETSPGDLDIKDRRIYVKTDPERGISVAKVAHDSIYNLKMEGVDIAGKGSYQATAASIPGQAVFAEVEVDIETGKIDLLRLVIGNDSGIMINPMTVEGQIEGGAAFGIGYCLYEHPVLDQETGNLLTDSFESYKIPSTLDIPPIDIIAVEEPDPVGPFGNKGVGESASVAIAPAIANAVYNAVGIRVNELPLTPDKILMALEAQQNQ
jgi:xanthine dehydrogenase molybdenum-binding subunit